MSKYSFEVVIYTDDENKCLVDAHVSENGEVTIAGAEKKSTYEPKYLAIAFQAIEQIKQMLAK